MDTSHIKSIFNNVTAKNAYYTRPYGIVAWGCTTVNMKQILVLQKRPIKILENIQYKEACRQNVQEILNMVNL